MKLLKHGFWIYAPVLVFFLGAGWPGGSFAAQGAECTVAVACPECSAPSCPQCPEGACAKCAAAEGCPKCPMAAGCAKAAAAADLPQVIALKFHADGCGYCKVIRPVFEELRPPE